ncbi:hypothetical protein DID78_01360 [Candidatus Marinamargulisbacteria bacterium SCGC AG-343-D04]|nr:hypothetical protein DID78_01360 [Candidatus Marinamargulisbacteria bacterium SCGC AG-343-D04]
MKKNIIRLLCLYLLITSVEGKLLTLSDVIQLTLENNLEKQIQTTSFTINKNISTIAESGLLPSIDFSYNSSNSTSDSSTTLSTGGILSGSNSNSSTNASTISLTQTLQHITVPFYTYKKLKQRTLQEQFRLELFIEELLLESISLFFDSVRLEKNLSLLKETLNNEELHYQKIQDQYKLGVSSLIELLETKKHLNTHKKNIISTEKQLSQHTLKLNHLMGNHLDDAINVNESIELNETLHLTELLNSASTHNLSIKIANQSKILTETEAKLIFSNIYPTLSLSLDYYNTESSANSGFITASDSSGTQVSGSLIWNIFNGGQDRNKIKNIKLAKTLTLKKQEQTKKVVQKEIKSIFVDYTSSKQIFKLLKENITTQLKHVKQSEHLFETGQLSITDLQSSQLNYLESKKEYNNMMLTLKLIELRLLQLSGKLHESITSPTKNEG